MTDDTGGGREVDHEAGMSFSERHAAEQLARLGAPEPDPGVQVPEGRTVRTRHVTGDPYLDAMAASVMGHPEE